MTYYDDYENEITEAEARDIEDSIAEKETEEFGGNFIKLNLDVEVLENIVNKRINDTLLCSIESNYALKYNDKITKVINTEVEKHVKKFCDEKLEAMFTNALEEEIDVAGVKKQSAMSIIKERLSLIIHRQERGWGYDKEKWFERIARDYFEKKLANDVQVLFQNVKNAYKEEATKEIRKQMDAFIGEKAVKALGL